MTRPCPMSKWVRSRVTRVHSSDILIEPVSWQGDKVVLYVMDTHEFLKHFGLVPLNQLVFKLGYLLLWQWRSVVSRIVLNESVSFRNQLLQALFCSLTDLTFSAMMITMQATKSTFQDKSWLCKDLQVYEMATGEKRLTLQTADSRNRCSWKYQWISPKDNFC